VRHRVEAHEAGHARHVDDRATVAHELQGLARAEERAVEMHADHPAPGLVRHGLGDLPVRREADSCHQLPDARLERRGDLLACARVAAGDAGVVDEDVEAPGFARDLREHRAHRAAVGDVGLDGARVPARGAHRGDGLAGTIELHVVHDDTRALFGEQERDGSADAGAAAGDERNAIGQSHEGLPGPEAKTTTATLYGTAEGSSETPWKRWKPDGWRRRPRTSGRTTAQWSCT
jgi:hypothetical protein